MLPVIELSSIITCGLSCFNVPIIIFLANRNSQTIIQLSSYRYITQYKRNQYMNRFLKHGLYRNRKLNIGHNFTHGRFI